MKKLSILLITLISLTSCYGQTIVNRAGPSNTVSDERHQAKRNSYLPRYADTTAANVAGFIGIDSCGARIFTYSPLALWYRGCSPKRWIRSLDVENFAQFIDTAQRDAVTSITVINDNSVQICTGNGSSCDTVTYVTSISNVTTAVFLTDSSIVVCDSAANCDTVTIEAQDLFYFAQQGLSMINGNIIEWGGSLYKNATIDIGGHKVAFNGTTVYDYLFSAYQGQRFSDGTGVQSWGHSGTPGAIDAANLVKLGINYTGNNYPSLGTGYMGNKIGYMLNVNGTGNGSFGFRIDNQYAKFGGIFFHTLDTSLTDAVTIFASRPPGATTAWNMQPTTMDSTRIAVFHNNKDIELRGRTYLNSKRFSTAQGAAVAAANNLGLGADGNVFSITGATQINAIYTVQWQAGSVIHLVFTSTPTVKHNTAGGAGTVPILLAGAVDFVAAATDVLTLLYNGTNWIETSRKQVSSSGSGSVTSVGLSMPSAFTVTNSPITTTGTLTVTGAGTTGQYIDGTGALQTFPTVPAGANPTATIGLTATNGVATTFLRSDGAPALSQAIVPTWTGIHTFGNNLLMLSSRLETTKGANVAAANDLTLGADGNLFTITGNTQINAITTSNWQAGSEIAFIFTGTPTLKNNTAGGGGTATMLLAGRVDYVAAAGDYIGLRYDGTNWYETNRKLAASGGTYAFSNALTESPAGTVKWGGTLTGNTNVTFGASFVTTFSSTNTDGGVTVFSVTNTGNAGAIAGISSGSNNTVTGQNSASGAGVFGSSSSGFGISGTSVSSVAGRFRVAPSSTNTTVVVGRFIRGSSGSPANGIGAAIDWQSTTDAANDQTSGRIASTWTTVADATRRGDLQFFTTKNASITLSLTLDGYGSMKLEPISATAASAITAADGMIVYVNTTDATFTAVGFWARENGVWVKM